MARERRPKISWPSWYHAPNGDSGVFHREEDVPDGWTRKKQSEYNAPTAVPIDREATIARLQELDIFIDPRWGKAKLREVLKEHD